ncbi:MAG: hypothetical protein ACLGHX_08705 [Acidimicrobiia bacterium]
MVSGRLVVMGSGETAPTMVGPHRAAIQAAGADAVVVLDSPFGFQENVDELTDRLREHFENSLETPVRVARLRRVDANPLEVARARSEVETARCVFAGPGSPSYALSVWRAHGIGELLTGVIRRGGSVTLASAAALTAGSHTLPVYEIYKVGEDPYWLEGLGVLAVFGIRAAVIPHWNNAEGGTHDTSRCYVGERRLRMLEQGLDCGLIGVDEHTAAVFDGAAGRLVAEGKGTVTIRGREERVVKSGEWLDFDQVIEMVGSAPQRPDAGVPMQTASFRDALAEGDVDGVVAAMLDAEARIDTDPSLRPELRSMIVRLGEAARQGVVDPREVVGGFVELLLELRRDARQAHRYEQSDQIRDGLAELGVEVRDAPDGAEWVLDEA